MSLKPEIQFGNYKGKPLVWMPLYKGDCNTYILKEPICKMPFDHQYNSYKTSLVRSFILDDFAPNAFSENDLSILEPNQKLFKDKVWLLNFFDIKKDWLKVNKKVFSYKHYWWVANHMDERNNPACWGTFCWIGTCDVTKNMNCGVRPCITFGR